jgi:hypothetical protein
MGGKAFALVNFKKKHSLLINKKQAKTVTKKNHKDSPNLLQPHPLNTIGHFLVY